MSALVLLELKQELGQECARLAHLALQQKLKIVGIAQTAIIQIALAVGTILKDLMFLEEEILFILQHAAELDSQDVLPHVFATLLQNHNAAAGAQCWELRLIGVTVLQLVLYLAGSVEQFHILELERVLQETHALHQNLVIFKIVGTAAIQ